MKEKILRTLLHGLLWLLVGTSVFIAAERAHTRRSSRKINRLQIEILDSTSHGQLITREMVEGWLRATKSTPGEHPMIDLDRVESIIARNGFVGEVNASVGYRGELLIRIRQRDPLFRLLVDGYNHYVTEQGVIFRAPHSSSICVPVVTGNYRPPFEASFEGELSAHRTASQQASAERIEALEREKYPLFAREQENLDYHRETRRKFIRQGLLESDEHFEKRVEDLRAEKKQRRRHYRYVQQQINKGIDQISDRQQAEENRQKKLEKNYEDFENLITFVKKIEANAFWHAEIVQIVTSQAHSGALEVELIPRSGAFAIRLGRLEQSDEKLERAEEFCERGFGRLGWDRFRTLDVSYEGQIICAER